MTDLSPAAQAVLDAYESSWDGHYIDGEWVPNHDAQLAAALRAAALYCKRDRIQLLAIADELDA